MKKVLLSFLACCLGLSAFATVGDAVYGYATQGGSGAYYKGVIVKDADASTGAWAEVALTEIQNFGTTETTLAIPENFYDQVSSAYVIITKIGNGYDLHVYPEWTYTSTCDASITAIKFPGSIQEILTTAITSWTYTALTEVTFMEGMTCINNGLFDKFTNLTTINLPSTMTSIGDGAFYGCTSLATINSNATTAPTVSGTAFMKWDGSANVTYLSSAVTLHCPDGESAFNSYNSSETFKVCDIEGTEKWNNLHVSSAYYATYYIDKPFWMPDGYTGWMITGASEGNLTKLAKYPGRSLVPANVPLLIQGSEGWPDVYIRYTNQTIEQPSETNLLHGETDSHYAWLENPENYYFYKLSLDNNGQNVGWYWGDQYGYQFDFGDGVWNKAFLAIERNNAGAAPRFIALNAQNATSLDEAQAAAADVKFIQDGKLMIRHNGQVFDANGRIVK